MAQGRAFLSAEWRNLVMLNYRVDPAILEKFVPRGTELDSFQGATYVSVVGFQFLHTRIFGVFPIPFHVNFDEVNLRFYVRRREGREVRRGVVFVKEIVPRRAIAQVARWSYGEKYFACPMRHTISGTGSPCAAYEWKSRGTWCAVGAEASSAAFLPLEGSLEQFITEHYWGYSIKRDGQSAEYRVSHVPWRVRIASQAHFTGDGDVLYGAGFGDYLSRPPDSAFIAEGSEIQVHMPLTLAARGDF
jgi:uncharacterized protein YqjF (DUF2071 family)